MTVKTTRSIKQRNAYRHRVDEFVVKPAKEIAKYRGLWMTGLSIVAVSVVSVYVSPEPSNLAAVGFIVGSGLVGLGWGGDDAIRRNFFIFRSDVLGHVLEDIDEQEEDSGGKLQPMTENKVSATQTAIVVGQFDFTPHQWRKFSTAVNDNEGKVNSTTIRNSGIFTNPTKNEKKYIAEFVRMGWCDADGYITQTATNWMVENNIIPPAPLPGN